MCIVIEYKVEIFNSNLEIVYSFVSKDTEYSSDNTSRIGEILKKSEFIISDITKYYQPVSKQRHKC